MDDDDGVLGQDGKVDDLDAQKLGKNTGADICDVGGTKTEHLVVHRQEHILEHSASVDKRLLGAGTAIDGAVDGVSHAGVLGKNDVPQHDLGLRLAHGGLLYDQPVPGSSRRKPQARIGNAPFSAAASATSCGSNVRSGSTAIMTVPIPMPSDALTPWYIPIPLSVACGLQAYKMQAPTQV